MSRGEGHFTEPFEGKDGKWYFDLKAANGETVAPSEGYETEEGARKGQEAVLNAAEEAISSREGEAEDEGISDQTRPNG
jgi:uncharacterized protein YegP (UPF0339 family)